MAPFYGWDSTATRLEPLRGGSLLLTTKFPEFPGTRFIDLRRMSRSWSHPVVLNTGPPDWESSVLTNRPLINHPKKASKHSLTFIAWAVFQQQVLHKVYQINTLIQNLSLK